MPRLRPLAALCLSLIACGDDGGPGEDAGTGAATSGATSTGAPTTGETAGDAAGLYEGCRPDGQCEDGLACQTYTLPQSGKIEWCGAACEPAMDGADCPPVADALAFARGCAEGVCGVRCDVQDQCPPGMTCRGPYCGYPIPL